MKTCKYFAKIMILIMGISMAAAFILGWINGARYTRFSYPKNQEIILTNDDNIDNISGAKRSFTKESAVELFIYLIIFFAVTVLLLLIPPSQSKENNHPDMKKLPEKLRKFL